MKGIKVVMVGFGVLMMTGCEKIDDLVNTATQNMKMEQTLPTCTLNEETFNSITCQNKTYVITDDTVNLKLIESAIAKVSVSLTLTDDLKVLSRHELMSIEWLPEEEIENRTHLTFGWIHEIKGFNPDDTIAVNVNDKYYLTKLN